MHNGLAEISIEDSNEN